MNKENKTTKQQIKDIDIIDLEADEILEEEILEEEDSEEAESWEEAPKKGIRRFLNLHVALVAVFLIVVFVCVLRLSNWGVQIDLDEIFKDGPGTYDNTFDEMFPIIDANSKLIEQDSLDTIVVFGNAPFSDDRNSEDNLASMLAELTDATVYNCAMQESYLACDLDPYDWTLAPLDAYCFHYLAQLAAGYDMTDHFAIAKDTLTLLNRYPEEADYIYETLTTLDFNTVDAIVIMYDATDYYKGHSMYNDNDYLDVTSFTGALETGIEVLKSTYPHIRIIVSSPTYAYAVDEEGNYVSSDQYTYSVQDVLSTYVIKQYGSSVSQGVSFVDNLYGTVTEDNAADYLIDNVHLNTAGRRYVAERLEYALNYYIKGYVDNE